MKNFILILLFIVMSMTAWSQTSCGISNLVSNEELSLVIDDYIHEFAYDDMILLVEAKTGDNMNAFRLTWSDDWLELFYRLPDSVFMYKNCFVYATVNGDCLQKKSDHEWLDNVLEQTFTVFDNGYKVAVDWDSCTFKVYDGHEYHTLADSFAISIPVSFRDYETIEYETHDGKIVNKRYINDDSLFFPDLYWFGIKRLPFCLRNLYLME